MPKSSHAQLDHSFKRLAIPPRLSDQVLAPISVQDHAKYLYYHNHFRRVLETIQRRGGTRKAMTEFGESASWLRAIDHLFRYWSSAWAFAYLHHTYPAHEGPDSPETTVDPLTFAFLWFVGFAAPAYFQQYRFRVEGSYACPACGRLTDRLGTVFRFGLPTCGCGRRILRPILTTVMVSPDFEDKRLIAAYRARCREQRVMDVVTRKDREPKHGVVQAFTTDRSGPLETRLRLAAENRLPVFILGKDHAAKHQEHRPMVGGLKLPGNHPGLARLGGDFANHSPSGR